MIINFTNYYDQTQTIGLNTILEYSGIFVVVIVAVGGEVLTGFSPLRLSISGVSGLKDGINKTSKIKIGINKASQL